MTTVNIHQAKTHLSRLLRLVAAGEEIVIANAGRPIARLVLFTERQGSRPLGTETGRIVVSDDFDAPLSPTVLSGFERADPG
ncbi:MAG: type II toxin-antitoxin system Phd/YefM family antitoxin [Gemmatimonadetes bacterium]|nr:type II toxin-antitoxin system Phd/YefM family antitoxin [Gemmatimonadota bacterium]MCK5489956.1 type II toxin-antitoxin system Phd/YefM family antitoxin [Gemmatimonadota bacterium]